jgi:hypothetical protein
MADFDEWAKEIGLVQKTIDVLEKQDLCDLKALRVFKLEYISQLKLTIGQAAILTDGVSKLQSSKLEPDPSTSPQEPVDKPTTGEILSELRKDSSLQEAVSKVADLGPAWAELLNPSKLAPTPPQAMATAHSVFDPVYYLKPKNTSKYYDITEFISPKKGDFEEVISSKEGMEIVIRSQEKSAKKVQLSSVSVTQWSIANVSILYQLILDGVLSQSNIIDYLAYTVKILELSFHHEWDSVLSYDREYRNKQAAYGFRWGTDPPHLGAAVLVPRAPKLTHDRRPPRQGNFKPKRPTTSKGEEICIGYNSRGGCRWGATCKFLHVCAEKGCEAKHPQVDHNKA